MNPSSQVKGTKSNSFLMNVVDLVPLACEDGMNPDVDSYSSLLSVEI